MALNCKSTWNANQVSSPNPSKCDWLKYMRLVFPKCNKLWVVCFFIFSLLSLLHKFHGNHEREIYSSYFMWCLGFTCDLLVFVAQRWKSNLKCGQTWWGWSSVRHSSSLLIFLRICLHRKWMWPALHSTVPLGMLKRGWKLLKPMYSDVDQRHSGLSLLLPGIQCRGDKRKGQHREQCAKEKCSSWL